MRGALHGALSHLPTSGFGVLRPIVLPQEVELPACVYRVVGGNKPATNCPGVGGLQRFEVELFFWDRDFKRVADAQSALMASFPFDLTEAGTVFEFTNCEILPDQWAADSVKAYGLGVLLQGTWR
jgi:hypothetical protein